MRHAVIMAGGAGTRLWPLSRKMRPKQLLRLFDGASLLQIARRRLAGLFEPQNIWVITNARYVDLVAAELSDLPRENLIGEPEGRDTANAIGLAAALLARRDPDATMAVFTADHLISPVEVFAAAIRTGLDAAEAQPTSLVTFGITPTSAHTGYGYLHRGERVSAGGAAGASAAPSATAAPGASLSPGVYRVQAFREKPARDVAEQYLASGEYYWNSGMFAWRASAIQAELAKHLPQNAAALEQIAASWPRTGTAPATAAKSAAAAAFCALPKISIDFGVMEKAASVLLVEMRCKWLDLGSWTAIGSAHTPDAAGNVAIGGPALMQDARGNVLVSESDHLLVALGVQDLVIVHSEDATLVCHREHEQMLKQLVALRQRRFGERFE